MVPQSIPLFLFTWGKLSDLINQDQRFSQMVCSSLHSPGSVLHTACWQTWEQLADRSGRAVNETPVSVSLPLGLAHRQTHNTLLWNGYLCLDTCVVDSIRAMFWILLQLFCWQNFIEVKCKDYNSTQWVWCRVAELCLSVLKGVDYQTTIAKVIQFTFWNHFACLSSSSCTLWCCS